MSDTRILFGFHAVVGRLRRRPDSVHEIYLDPARRDARARDLAARAAAAGVRVIEADASRIERIAGAEKHQGVAARVVAIELRAGIEDVIAQAQEPVLLLVLDGVQDPHNLGACLRVADGFGAHAVIAPKDRAVALTPTVAKVAAGAADAVPYLQVTNLARTLKQLQQAGIWVIGADQEGADPLPAARLDGPLAWVLGAEGEGLRRLTRESCDQLVRIPMQGSVESLNVSVAAGICLYESRRQRAMSQRAMALNSRSKGL
ncbi:MAG: 23S rRNA (guanosine(2251)-2'-O)-methyltransferase RlmB [Betaproteobacteria bacterium]|nr:23S rRNA (guanosine(2251)-2'-O)-methyltransferase RlmB [Betaproteobacteria bacterium]